jgi:rhamnogalacturonyl hydrolase YesR
MAGAFWGRGNRWMAASTADVLGAVGANNPTYQIITDAFRWQMKMVKQLQDPNGIFHTTSHSAAIVRPGPGYSDSD